MQLKNILLLSLSAVALAQNASPESDNAMEAPQDISKLKPKCPEQKCPKPKVHKLTKNITKTVMKTVTKSANKCQSTH
ncbi:hypothetical protein B0I72DRAFT_142087 [Yarrowia lipolytica]|nr:hypothetical protein BKA91DRAFT_142884 [Yarrowia lipolytica]KAE8168826.1 hypothetical protein BKA90DRAFT_143614 [Yarrowia lipolytica]RDW30106.1 hypothetical protein B0I72DRAFT_142087 [Yarrowia lipolytica]RMI94119.1 hypothetical protein BD777DRAFT_132179 [Yarrowia lipolytica]VBB85210.1 Hypothetical protein conserved in the Yarrowia clade [Yarrowia lipolytica]